MKRQTAIITGATKGLGRAMALEFARAGHLVIGLYHSDDSAAADLAGELQPSSGDSVLIKHDVSAENAELWETPEIRAAAELVLINNASAPFRPQPLHLLSWSDFEQAWQTSVKGAWTCSRAVLRTMVKARAGVIVNVSTAAVLGSPPKGFAAYATAKHGLRGLTLALAEEYAGKGIRIFSVSPGFMATALTAGWDERLLQIMRTNGPVTDPAIAASKIRALVENGDTPGVGEDYPV